MTHDPSAAVRKLLIEGQGVPAAKVTPHARMLHDLGVDGDDAGELFQALHARFGTDFTELNRQWRMFLNTEGASPRAILVGIPAVIVCGGAAGALVGIFHWPKITALGLALALFVGGGRPLSRWVGHDIRPVAVSGLSEIIQAGSWPADSAEVR